MAEEKVEGDAAEGEGEAAPKKKGGLLLYIIIGVVVLLIGAAAGLYFTGALNSLLGVKKEADAAAEPVKHEPTYFDLPDLLVNLNIAGGRKATFLKVSIALEIENKEELPKLSPLQPRIVDTFQTYLRELRPEDLRGSGGLYRLREELLTRVNLATAPLKVNDVLFKEMLVQ